MDEESSEPDILEQESRLRLPSPGWRPSRAASILAAVTLAIGLAVGYAAGHSQGRGTAAAPSESATPEIQAPGGTVSETIDALAPSGPAVTENPGTCSVQAGRDLELGIQVTNQSAGTVVLESVKPVTPLPGLLKVLSWHWGPCGFDNDGIIPDTVALGPGESMWVIAIVQPLVKCPGPAPLQFQVSYAVGSQQSTASLPGFPDLTGVPYSGCPAPAG